MVYVHLALEVLGCVLVAILLVAGWAWYFEAPPRGTIKIKR